MCLDRPELVNDRDTLINQRWDFLEMRRRVRANIDWLFAEAPAELGDVGHRSRVQRPKRVFIERLDALCETDLNAVNQQIVLAKKVLLLHASVERWIVCFTKGHH